MNGKTLLWGPFLGMTGLGVGLLIGSGGLGQTPADSAPRGELLYRIEIGADPDMADHTWATNGRPYDGSPLTGEFVFKDPTEAKQAWEEAMGGLLQRYGAGQLKGKVPQ